MLCVSFLQFSSILSHPFPNCLKMACADYLAAREAVREAMVSEWGRQWQQLAPHQVDMVRAHCLCVSFHWVEHPLFERLHVARVVDAVGEDKCVVLEDAEDAECLKRRFLGSLAWMSPMFWSSNPRVVEAISSWMQEPSHTVGWSLFDDGTMIPPRWPTMGGRSPWRPNVAVERFREEVKAMVEEKGPSGCGVDWMVERMADLNREMADRRWSVEQPWPSRPVFCPAQWWGASWAREGETMDSVVSEERAELVRILEEDARRAEEEQEEEGSGGDGAVGGEEETVVKEVVVGAQGGAGAAVGAQAGAGARRGREGGEVSGAEDADLTAGGKRKRPKHRARARERKREAKARAAEEVRVAQAEGGRVEGVSWGEVMSQEAEALRRGEVEAQERRDAEVRRRGVAEERRRREGELRRQREAEQRRLSEAAERRVRREALNRQKFEVFRARRNLNEQVALMERRERELAGRGSPASRGSVRPGPFRGGRGAVGRGSVVGRGGLVGRGGGLSQSRPQGAVRTPPPDPQPSLADVMGVVRALGDRLGVVEQASQQASFQLSRAGSAGLPVASSSPAPLRPPRTVGEAPAAETRFLAADYRAAEGLVPLVRGVLEPALPMDSTPSLQ